MDANFVYAAFDQNGTNRILRVDAATGAVPPWAGLSAGSLLVNHSGGHGVFGLAADAARLWVSNFAQNRVEIYGSTARGLSQSVCRCRTQGAWRPMEREAYGWPMAGIRGDAVSGHRAVLAEIVGLAGPYAVSLGGPADHLFVGEIGSGGVPRVFDAVDLTQVRELFAQAQPGPIHDDAFCWKPAQRADLAVP